MSHSWPHWAEQPLQAGRLCNCLTPYRLVGLFLSCPLISCGPDCLEPDVRKHSLLSSWYVFSCCLASLEIHCLFLTKFVIFLLGNASRIPITSGLPSGQVGLLSQLSPHRWKQGNPYHTTPMVSCAPSPWCIAVPLAFMVAFSFALIQPEV